MATNGFVALCLIGLYTLYTIFCLIRNIIAAKSIGFPVVWSPISPFNPFWILFNKRVAPILQHLPLNLGDWTKYNALDWTWVDRTHGSSQVHDKHGETFAHATPGEIEIHTRDPTVAIQVLRKQANDFPKISHYAKILDLLGTSLVSSDGDDWTRHRKATVATLSDRTNRLVWAESVRQTQQMIHHYQRISNGLISDPVEDIRELYLHVFTSVCFGVAYDFKQPERDSIPMGHSQSYKYCLHTSLKDILILRLVPSWAMKLPALPQRIKNFRDATIEMRQYLDEMINNCKENFRGSKKKTQNDNLLSFMVKRNRDLELEPHLGGSKDDGSRALLTESEIRGNLFTYSLGGHESSAHTLTFAIYVLAALPEEQVWLAEEIDEILGERRDWRSKESFMDIFPRLKRCQAVMLEILRLYPSVTVLPKFTGSRATTLFVGSEDHRIPANINIFVNMPSIQVHEPIWGPDADSWKPGRWIITNNEIKGLDGEQIKVPPDGAFLPWSEGKRACPGKRFSQVGFVAALSTLLYKHRLEVIPNEGESMENARKRVMGVIDDTYAVMTVHMHDPLSVKIKIAGRS
ncbi:cytochrome P450 [Colletotrichum orchidophilum]|uniref:Cytochrome P450 n=1 Tax=Colletotrichum orchidophilum TaxID=1209926 RepID=A0A1G4BQT1_9PEZI|nr:cytochrome P450 [Colletotrichum orchidophilum]OHF03814.1 cytochrome P450 [Colletotrichum orchidophilum]